MRHADRGQRGCRPRRYYESIAPARRKAMHIAGQTISRGLGPGANRTGDKQKRGRGSAKAGPKTSTSSPRDGITCVYAYMRFARDEDERRVMEGRRHCHGSCRFAVPLCAGGRMAGRYVIERATEACADAGAAPEVRSPSRSRSRHFAGHRVPRGVVNQRHAEQDAKSCQARATR